jgi:hypothetical protein
MSPDLGDMTEVGYVDTCGERSLPRERNDQTLPLEPLERFPDRCSPHTELLGESTLNDCLVGADIEHDQLVLNRGIDTISARDHASIDLYRLQPHGRHLSVPLRLLTLSPQPEILILI